MSHIRVTKNIPISFVVRLKDDSTLVNLNDGTWSVSVQFHYQTSKGKEPFVVTPAASGSSVLVNLTAEQTNQLTHLGTGYVLVVTASKLDGSVNIKTETPVHISNGL